MSDNTTCFHYRLKTHSSSRNNSHKLPIPFSDMLYQYDGGSKLWIDLINEANILRALVNDHLSPMVDSELFLLNKFVRMTIEPFTTVISLDDNEILMTKSPTVTDTTIFKVDMNLTPTMASRWSCSVKQIETKKTAKKSRLLKYSESWIIKICMFKIPTKLVVYHLA